MSYGDYNAKTDIYSFGILLINLILNTLAKTKEYIQYEQDIWIDEFEKNFENGSSLLRTYFKNKECNYAKCLDNNPDNRPTTDELLQDLKKLNTPESFKKLFQKSVLEYVNELNINSTNQGGKLQDIIHQEHQ